MFGLLLLHAHKLSEAVRGNLEVQVYLDRDLPETELLRLQQDLAGQPYVAEQNGQPQLRFVSKEEGRSPTTAKLRAKISITFWMTIRCVTLTCSISGPTIPIRRTCGELSRSLEQQRGVFEVQYPKSLYASINQNLARVSLLLLALRGGAGTGGGHSDKQYD
ncbi:MAG: hypothetical protein WKG07_09825 [Hymenobacter sp.]